LPEQVPNNIWKHKILAVLSLQKKAVAGHLLIAWKYEQNPNFFFAENTV